MGERTSQIKAAVQQWVRTEHFEEDCDKKDDDAWTTK